ncbi:hypothetical protein MAE02_48370 [Microvirga aerophila]|uniref:Uncharacterized protein n=1 Tax=Microvirga aerophila TaxID=670291 RepID=A0A512BYU2_9HYPH|nr:hypothetical protein MAE02_48370 [Microvirga aerophila]
MANVRVRPGVRFSGAMAKSVLIRLSPFDSNSDRYPDQSNGSIPGDGLPLFSLMVNLSVQRRALDLGLSATVWFPERQPSGFETPRRADKLSSC